MIVPCDLLGGYEPIVHRYYPSSPVQEKVTIALVSGMKAEWFESISRDENNQINVVYKEESVNYINHEIKRCLKQCAEFKADIIVFPELIINDHTISEVKNFLLDNYSEFREVKFICLGSYWSENSNVGYILSPAGNVLLEINKKVPFDVYDKEAKVFKTENILESDSKLHLLDIEGLGRIAYLICKDALDGTQANIIYSYLWSDIGITSAFSPKTGEFKSCSKARTGDYCISTFLCNSCVAINDNNEAIAFVTMPKVAEGKNIEAHSIEIKQCDLKSGACNNCNCIHVITINTDIIEAEGWGKADIICNTERIK